MLWAAALASHSCTAEQTRNIAVLQPKVFYNIANTPGIPSLLTYGPTAEVVDAGQACTIATGDDRIANSRLPNYFNTNTISADQKNKLHRKRNNKLRKAAFFCIEFDASPVLLNNFVTDGEPEAGALTC